MAGHLHTSLELSVATPNQTILNRQHTVSDFESSNSSVPPFTDSVHPHFSQRGAEQQKPSLACNHRKSASKQVNHVSRGGFNNSDFTDSIDSHPSQGVRIQIENNQFQHSLAAGEEIGFREQVYRTVESTPVAATLTLIMLFDSTICVLAFLFFLQDRHVQSLERAYSILDWVTCIVFFVEINARLYCYGFKFYFHSALRGIDFVVCFANTLFIFCTLFSKARWLLITRLCRLLRISISLATWRERQFKLKARRELEHVALLLKDDRAEERGLTKWRIRSQDIAIGERAGHGGFGTVFSGLFRGTLVAVKQIPAAEREESSASIEDEAITLVNLRHPNVVLFMGFVCEPSMLWIVTEYCSRGSLRDVLENEDIPLSEGRALKLALGAARGLAYLHGQDPPVLHLDLKTSNILISSGWDAKLGDFGLSRNVTNIERDCFSGTMQYSAPEILEANMFSTAADIYSFGVCLWEIAAREVPFLDKSPMSVLWGVVKSNLRPSLQVLQVRDDERNLEAADETTKNEHLNHPLGCQRASDIDDAIHSRKKPEALKGSGTAVSVSKSSKAGLSALRTARLITASQSQEKLDLNAHGHVVFNGEKQAEKAHINNPATRRDVFPEESKSKSSLHGLHEDAIRSSWKSRSALRRQPSPRTAEQGQGTHLADISRRVTATIQKFDDRPPAVRRKNTELSPEGQLDAKAQAGEITTSFASPFSSVIKHAFKRRPPLNVSVPSTTKQAQNQREMHVRVTSEVVITEERAAFARRLANFAQQNNKQHISVDKRFGENSAELSEVDFSKKSAAGRRQRRVAVPKQYLDLIQKCWAQDPSDRPSASEIVWNLVVLIKGEMR